ncbi:hypothetical protein K474DRAFT_1679888, partial [Panus rudis PR-1116 ss-1]
MLAFSARPQTGTTRGIVLLDDIVTPSLRVDTPHCKHIRYNNPSPYPWWYSSHDVNRGQLHLSVIAHLLEYYIVSLIVSPMWAPLHLQIVASCAVPSFIFLMVAYCEGCTRNFSMENFLRHLALTKNPQCQAYRDRIRGRFPSGSNRNPSPNSSEDGDNQPMAVDHTKYSSGSEPDAAPSDQDHDHDGPEVVLFDGDYFGDDYGPADFGMEEDADDLEYNYEVNGSQYGGSDDEDFEHEAPDPARPPSDPSSSSSSSTSGHSSPSPPSSPSLPASPTTSSGSSPTDTSRSSTPADHLAGLAARNARLRVEKALRQDIHIKPFPLDSA